MDQAKYDEATQAFRRAVWDVLEVGNDDLDGTGEDLKEILENEIESAKEDD